MTLESLRAYGANVDEGLARCFNKEAFYLKLVGMALADGNFEKLEQAEAAGDVKGLFEAAHALKGAIGNVSLTPIYEPVCALTEMVRGQSAPAPGSKALVEQILTALQKARAL